jgi:opacity protein-like surface antigen
MNKVITLSVSLLSSTFAFAQDDLMKELEASQKPEITYIGQTFKGTRIINGQSVETKAKGALEFIFSHRFGRINSGAYTLWGLDDAFVRLGFEYGLTDKLGVGIGRSSTDKSYDSYLRYKIARQSTGARNFPVTITAMGTTNIKTSPNAAENPLITFEDRLSYVAQVMFARKFSTNFSAQITPIFVHRNTVDQSKENNDDIAIGVGARYKITRSLALSGEYYYRLNPHENTPYYNSIGFGLDIETGGHVFQLLFTNSLGMIERAVVAETDGNFGAGDIHFGFNISRTFQIKKPK